MAFFPDVLPGDKFKPNALLSNNIRHIVNAFWSLNGSRLPYLSGKAVHILLELLGVCVAVILQIRCVG